MIKVVTVGSNGINFKKSEMTIGNAVVDLVFDHIGTHGFKLDAISRIDKDLLIRVRRSTTIWNEYGRLYRGHHREMRRIMRAIYLHAKLDRRVSQLEYANLLRVTDGFTPWEELDIYYQLGQRFDKAARIALAIAGYVPDESADGWTPDGMKILVAGLVDENYRLDELLELAAAA